MTKAQNRARAVELNQDRCQECGKYVGRGPLPRLCPQHVPPNPMHTRDEHCTVSPDTGCCIYCGVDHGETCPECDGHGFHAGDCNFAVSA